MPSTTINAFIYDIVAIQPMTRRVDSRYLFNYIYSGDVSIGPLADSHCPNVREPVSNQGIPSIVMVI